MLIAKINTYLGIVLMFFMFWSFEIKAQDHRFEHISLEEGLSQSTVNCILQDEKGFIWFGTQDGLNRFDGYGFTVYKKDLYRKKSISGNFITALMTDRKGLLWVGTADDGLNLFNSEREEYIHYKYDKGKKNVISSNNITSIVHTKNGDVWVGTLNGLNRLRFTEFSSNKISIENYTVSNTKNLLSNVISCLYVDSEGVLWVGTEKGISRFFVKNKQQNVVFEKIENNLLKGIKINCIVQDGKGDMWCGTEKGLYRIGIQNKRLLIKQYGLKDGFLNENITVAYETKDKELWVGTYGGGVYKIIYTEKDIRLANMRKKDNIMNGLSGDFILSLYEDKSGTFWIGTDGAGVNKLNKNAMAFSNIKIKEIANNTCFSIYQEEADRIWLGTFGEGLISYNIKDNTYKQYKNKPGTNSISNNVVMDILSVKPGYLLIGTYGGGLNIFNINTGRFTRNSNAVLGRAIPDNTIRVVYKDKKGFIWLGTNKGLCKMRWLDNANKLQTLKIFQHRQGDTNSLLNEKIWAIFEDDKQNIWVGTDRGVECIEFDDSDNVKRIKHYINNEKNLNSLSASRILSIMQDKKGRMWFGTYGGGLCTMDKKTEKFYCFNQRVGMYSDVVYGIVEDRKGYLWFSTNKGIVKFNPNNKQFKNYGIKDGIQSDEFNSGAFFKNNDGEMYFGGINGVTFFHPDSVYENRVVPKTVITKFQLNNDNVGVFEGKGFEDEVFKIDSRYYIQKNISYTNRIELSYKEKMFSFEFSAMHFAIPEKNQYAYMLEGFDDDWIYQSSGKRYATYTNIDPGRYVFKVKSSNNDGVWSDEATGIDIIIYPPFWRTWWFYLLSAVLMIFVVYIIFVIRLHQIKLITEKMYFQKQSEAKTAMMKETHHRVKNNLQMINNLLKLQSTQVADVEVLKMFQDAQSRVLSMANIHEEMYKSDNLKQVNIKTHFSNLIPKILEDNKVGKNITLDLKIDDVELDVKTLVPLGLIINEMITNSLKYAFKDREEGVIIVHLTYFKDKFYELIIGDNGVGMSLDFDIDKSSSLGTKLIKSFTEQINGTIQRLDVPGTVYKILFCKID